MGRPLLIKNSIDALGVYKFLGDYPLPKETRELEWLKLMLCKSLGKKLSDRRSEDWEILLTKTSINCFYRVN